MKGLSEVTSRIDGQPMFKYLDRARELEAKGRHLIHMELGEPDFDTPKNVTLSQQQIDVVNKNVTTQLQYQREYVCVAK